MHNVDLSADDALEFPDLPHRVRDRTSSGVDVGELEVGNQFTNKDSFIGALKQHSIKNGVNYHVVNQKLISLRRSVRCKTAHVHGKSSPR